MERLIGYANLLHEAGVKWAISSYASEAANFAMFIGLDGDMQKVALRIRKAAEDLKVETARLRRVRPRFSRRLQLPERARLGTLGSTSSPRCRPRARSMTVARYAPSLPEALRGISGVSWPCYWSRCRSAPCRSCRPASSPTLRQGPEAP